MPPQAAKQFHSAIPSFAAEKTSAGCIAVGAHPKHSLFLNLFLSLHHFPCLGRTVGRDWRNIRWSRTTNPKLLPQFHIHARKNVLVLFQESPNILPALANTFTLVAVPRPTLVDDVMQHRKIQNVSLARDTL